jgi:hypothetical protein
VAFFTDSVILSAFIGERLFGAANLSVGHGLLAVPMVAALWLGQEFIVRFILGGVF